MTMQCRHAAFFGHWSSTQHLRFRPDCGPRAIQLTASSCRRPLRARRKALLALQHRSILSQRSKRGRCLVCQAAMGPMSSLILSAGIFLLGLALAILAVTSIPLLLEMRRTAQHMQRVASALEKEIPDTASTMRLTSLELADAIQEVSLLSSDVTRGLQSGARSLQMVESTVKQGADFVQATATERVLPAIRARLPKAYGKLEERLLANVKLNYSMPEVLQMASTTKTVARRMRMALAAADVYTRASAFTSYALSRRSRPPEGPVT